jgi:hypothetical protein
LVALLTTDTLPVTLPEVVGLKITLKVVVCPAAKVRGSVRPLVLKPAPETLIWEMVTLEVELVSVTGRVLLLPTATFPKLTLVGLAES